MKKLIAVFIIITMGWSALKTQDLFEDSGNPMTYQLNRFKILVIAYENCSYEETTLMSDKWKKWGAHVEIAADKLSISATKVAMINNRLQHTGNVSLKADILLSHVNSDKYDVIYIVGGDNYRILLEQHVADMNRILTNAYNQGKIIAAFCHAPAILSNYDFIKGKHVTVEGNSQRQALMKSGAIVKNEIIVCDKNIITGRFPYSETFINFIAEKLQYPEGNGPFAALSKNRNETLNLLTNVTNSHLFANRQIPKDTLEIIMNTGLKSQMSEYYYYNKVIRFICVRDPLIIDKIKELLVKKNIKDFSDRPNPEAAAGRYIYGMMEHTQAIVLSYNDYINIDTIGDKKFKQQVEMKYTSYNGASCQNMLIASKALGIGGILGDSGWFSEIDVELKEMLNLSKSYKLINAVILGYSDYDGVPIVTRPINEYVQFK